MSRRKQASDLRLQAPEPASLGYEIARLPEARSLTPGASFATPLEPTPTGNPVPATGPEHHREAVDGE
jgi:hypothetical protein